MLDKFAALRHKYLSSFPSKREEIESAHKKQNVELLHDLIHKLAGSSGGYGFDEISRQCKTLLYLFHEPEKSQTNNSEEEIDKAIQRILLLLQNEE